MSEIVIEAKDLTKRYGKAVAVDHVSFTVERGEIFGLLGPNGAGKTTTILMLLGLSDITSGQVRVLGLDPARQPLVVKRRVGYMPDTVGFYDNLTASENLRYTARLIGLTADEREPKIASALDRVGLKDVTDHHVGTFSRGMRQRLGLAEILIKDAEIAILDEPTSGLDPTATSELLAIIRGLKHDGVAMLISSHLLERVQSVCDRVALFNEGRIALMGTVAQLGREVLGGGFVVDIEADGAGLGERLALIPGVSGVEHTGVGKVRLHADRDVRPEAAVEVVAMQGRLKFLGIQEPSLEAIYTRYFESKKDERERIMRREGSAFQGLSVVMLKELSDHLTSARMRVLEWLVVLTALAALYGAIQQIKDTTAEDPFLFLRLFTTSRDPLPSFVSFLAFLVPLMAIGLGFDLINAEHNRRTLSRILAQPIYRDALLFGKYLAGLVTLSISLIALWLLVIGLGLVLIGIPPGAEEMARSVVFLMVTIIYAGVWLALAMLFSILFRSPATAALVTLGMWLFLTLIWPALAPAVAVAVWPSDDEASLILAAQAFARLSPSTLFGEIVVAILNPATRTLGPIYLSQLQGAVIGAPLPLSESIMIAWPQIVGMIAAAIGLFVIGYVIFQRQEVRA